MKVTSIILAVVLSASSAFAGVVDANIPTDKNTPVTSIVVPTTAEVQQLSQQMKQLTEMLVADAKAREEEKKNSLTAKLGGAYQSSKQWAGEKIAEPVGGFFEKAKDKTAHGIGTAKVWSYDAFIGAKSTVKGWLK